MNEEEPNANWAARRSVFSSGFLDVIEEDRGYAMIRR